MEPVAPAAEPPTAPSPRPVMDVVPPTAPETMAIPPLEDELDQSEDAKPPDPSAAKPNPLKTSPKAHQPHQNTTAAIVATVIIVFGLAALATYAYIKTK